MGKLKTPADELEKPDFDGRQFTAGEPHDDVWPSRAHGWALVIVFLLVLMAFYWLRDGALAGAIVLFALAAGMFALSAVMIRKELRKYREYRRRL